MSIKRQKGKSILTYILIPVCILIVAEAFVFLGTMVISGIRGQMEKNAYDIVQERVSTRKSDLQSDMLITWTDIEQLQTYINDKANELEDAGIMDFNDTSMDSEKAEPLIDAVSEQMVSTLRARHVNSIYMVLNVSDLQTVSNKPGLYLLDQDSDSAPSRRNQDLLIKRGSSSLVKKLGISTAVNWKPNFVFEEKDSYPDFVYKPVAATVKGEHNNYRDYGYWSLSTNLLGDTERTLTFSVPLKNKDGQTYGVLGVGILESYLKEKLPKSEIHDSGSGFYCIATRQEGSDDYTIVYSDDESMSHGTQLHLSENQSKFQLSGNDTNMYVSSEQLILYNRNTPYESEQWYLIAIIPEKHLMAFANGIYLRLVIALILMVVVGVIGGIFVSFRITTPIKKLYMFMEDSSGKEQENLPKTNINEIDHLVTNIEELNQKLNQDKSHIIMGLTRDYLNVFLVHPMNDTAKIIKLDGYITSGVSKDNRGTCSYRETIDTYISERVYEKDSDAVRNALNAAGLEKNLADKDEYNLTYRVLENDEIYYYQVKIIKAKQIGQYIIGFQNIDFLMKEEKRKQQLYEKALKESQKANVAKTNFLSRMSHDIRTPINGIVGMTTIMENEIDNRELVIESVQKVKLLSGQLELLINDVLEMSRIESGKISLSHEIFDLYKKLGEIAPAIQVMAEERGIELTGAHYNIEHNVLISSPVHVQRIVMNILSNAVKYNKPGGTAECWLTEIPLDETHSTYEFKVSDTGIGMSEEFLNQIFEPFSREQTTPDTTYSGTGLGMAITKELVDRMGGSINIQSKQDVGTTVTIRIPLEFVEAIPETDDEPAPISLVGKHILLVEDNELNLEIAKYILTQEHVILETASNGSEAVRKFAASRKGTFDLILMDVMMPVMNGLDATRKIRNLNHPDAKTVPIIAMTANAFEEDIRQCKDAGMNEHIAKPIDIQTMKRTITKVLNIKYS